MTVFIFAGTGDGRRLIATLLDRAERRGIELEAHIFCATEYGAELAGNEAGCGHRPQINVIVHRGRLDYSGILNEITVKKPDFVIDCTHPFAEIVTKNLKAACESGGRHYLRLRREMLPEEPSRPGDIFYVDSVREAASFLADKPGNILLSTGSKEIMFFSGLEFSSRVYPRVLPLDESLRACREAGVPVKNIIAMQGPFTEDLNRAVIRLVNASWLVSKETGAEGGFAEKVSAALAENCRLIAVRPPAEEGGLDADAITGIVCGKLPEAAGPQSGLAVPSGIPGASGGCKKFFPVFQDITDKKFLIVGAGGVAFRRLKTLLRFRCRVEIIAPVICAAIKGIRDERVSIIQDVYREGCREADFVIAATDDRAVNRMIAAECVSKNIPVSVADCKEESTFYFPAIVCTSGLTVGITSDGLDHYAVSGAARRIETLFREDQVG